MTIYHVAAALVLGLGAGVVSVFALGRLRDQPRHEVTRILLPFTGGAMSRRALDSALRLARAEHATLVPAYLAVVPLRLDLRAPLTLECAGALPLLDAVEQRAHRFEVPVDTRIERGRSARDALQRLLAEERFDRIVLPAASHAEVGFSPADVAWILGHVDGEVLVFRAAGAAEVVRGAPVASRG